MAKFKNLQEAAAKLLATRKFKATVTAHTWKKGDIVEVSNAFVTGGYVQVSLTNGMAYNLTLTQLEPVIETLDELQSNIVVLEKEISIQKAKIEYLTQTNQETFDETEFKVWNTLQLLKGKKNDLEKAKAIAALINS